ncbi:RNA ligase [Nonomuraea sp. NPDC059023]|uniref:RNA ligase n=1 Tax=unclassified Nonomuraea TaxID=2593643 RepID=UPI00369BF4C6
MRALTALTLADLIDPGELQQNIAKSYVRVQTHPVLPYSILNYSDLTQYHWAWNDVTRQCRGLIIDAPTGQIIARPFPKFFNYHELLADGRKLPLSTPAIVTDKLDGQLGILYPTGSGGYAIATRGSFTSLPAQHATTVWEERYAHGFHPEQGYTYLFEIIYPAGRIVCDYNGMDDLILLGAVEIATGHMLLPEHIGWPGPSAPTFPHATLGDALAAPPRPGAEGMVVHLPDLGVMLKLKQDDYKALHAIFTRTSARSLWQHLAVNACQHLATHPKQWQNLLGLDPRRAERCRAVGPNWLPKILDGVPDEFHAWVRDTLSNLTSGVAALEAEIRAFADLALYVYGGDRKALVREVLDHPHYGAVLKLIDGDDIAPYLWRSVYPDADRPFLVQPEDAA